MSHQWGNFEQRVRYVPFLIADSCPTDRSSVGGLYLCVVAPPVALRLVVSMYA